MTQRGRPEDMIPGPQYEDTPEDYTGPIEYINWNGYKIAVNNASRLNAEFFNEIAARRRENRSVIIIVTGEPGEGKTYFAMRFAEIFDPKFTILDVGDERTIVPGQDPTQIPFERENFLYLIGNESPLDYGQCIIPDEAQFAMGARRWYEDIQKSLMESIEAVRSKGYIIIVVALHLDLLDRIIRKFILTYMFHLEARGKAVVYRLFTPRFEGKRRQRRLGEIMLNLPGVEVCNHSNCLLCNYSHIVKGTDTKYRRCKSVRAKYERRKKNFVDGRSAVAQAKSQHQKLKERVVPDAEMAEVVYVHRDRLTWMDRTRRMDPVSLQVILEDELGVAIGTQKAYKIRARVELAHPELKAGGKGDE